MNVSESTAEGDAAAKERSDDRHQKLDAHHHRRGVAISSFSSTPNGSMALQGHIYRGESGILGVIDHLYRGALHVEQAGSRKCTLLITSSHLILEYTEDGMYEEEAGEYITPQLNRLGRLAYFRRCT